MLKRRRRRCSDQNSTPRRKKLASILLSLGKKTLLSLSLFVSMSITSELLRTIPLILQQCIELLELSSSFVVVTITNIKMNLFFWGDWICRYNESEQPVCRVCNVVLKSESLWDVHQASRKHHEVILMLVVKTHALILWIAAEQWCVVSL